jgi:hypothetical protein
MRSAPRVSEAYDFEIASGEKIPHPRHWVKLAEFGGDEDRSLSNNASRLGNERDLLGNRESQFPHRGSSGGRELERGV